MLHCDEETLSLLALGESSTAEAESHVAECPRCAAELAALRYVVTAARSSEPTDPTAGAEFLDGGGDIALDEVRRVAPPAQVWAQIAAATGVTTAPRPDEITRHTGPAPTPARPRPVPVPAPRRRPLAARPGGRLLAVAASCLVVGVLGGVIGARLVSEDGPAAPSTQVLAETPLAGLPAAPSASGRADVVGNAQGRTLDVDVSALGAANGFYQVWLIDPTVTKMVPVGVLSGSRGTFTLPAGVDIADYPVVDVSLEPLDGNPAHSGKSVLRGTLRS